MNKQTIYNVLLVEGGQPPHSMRARTTLLGTVTVLGEQQDHAALLRFVELRGGGHVQLQQDRVLPVPQQAGQQPLLAQLARMIPPMPDNPTGAASYAEAREQAGQSRINGLDRDVRNLRRDIAKLTELVTQALQPVPVAVYKKPPPDAYRARNRAAAPPVVDDPESIYQAIEELDLDAAQSDDPETVVPEEAPITRARHHRGGAPGVQAGPAQPVYADIRAAVKAPHRALEINNESMAVGGGAPKSTIERWNGTKFVNEELPVVGNTLHRPEDESDI